MSSAPLFSKQRQLELQRINRVLAVLVVIFAFSTAYLWAIQQQWFVKPESPAKTELIPAAATDVVVTVPLASSSAFTRLSAAARTHRTILPDPISQSELLRLLWFAQGNITDWGERTVPSYKSLFPIDLYIYVRRSEDMKPGIYHYQAKKAELTPVTLMTSLQLSEQIPTLEVAPVLIIAVNRNPQDQASQIESGGIAQQILLGATEMKLATYLIPHSATPNLSLNSIVDQDQAVQWLMPIGRPNPNIN